MTLVKLFWKIFMNKSKKSKTISNKISNLRVISYFVKISCLHPENPATFRINSVYNAWQFHLISDIGYFEALVAFLLRSVIILLLGRFNIICKKWFQLAIFLTLKLFSFGFGLWKIVICTKIICFTDTKKDVFVTNKLIPYVFQKANPIS